MIFREPSRKRPVQLGRFPLEVLPTDLHILKKEHERARLAAPPPQETVQGELSIAAQQYFDLFMEYRQGKIAPAKAPVPDDMERRSIDIKGSLYFLNAAHAGICLIPENAWLQDRQNTEHTHAVVFALEIPRQAEKGNLARDWLLNSRGMIASTRAAGIAANIANYCGELGYSATAHMGSVSDVDIERLAVLSGICCRAKGHRVVSPFLGDNVVLAVVTTSYACAVDTPLATTQNRDRGFKYWLGINGAESGRERHRRGARATHLGSYPMEQVRRVERPTTLILDDEIPRVPHRASFFERPKFGDLGPKAKLERTRFAFKTPAAQSYMPLIGSMVPLQDNDVAPEPDPGMNDADQNSKAVKSLAYALGADMVGICKIPRYSWYSHHNDGKPITPYHRYAVVMLIDQGHETMEGASGDDWISGPQSMRAYMRGAEIAGIMARFLCDKGYSSRPQTNVLSHVLHIPLILWAGLGELSRIGELVLNPFVGPRFKSVVVTTDLPLTVDKPIDFGLQDFCNNCHKCARECPCGAIPMGDKVVFNGYEMWKIDAERCTRYRLTNQRGAGCGRCMKTCPLNKVPNADGAVMIRVASWLGVNARWLKPLMVPVAVRLDDWLGNGRRNLLKKWWLDLEIVDGVSVHPVAGTNQRDIDPTRQRSGKDKIVYYHADIMPPPDATGSVPVDRKSAAMAASKIETPAQAAARYHRGDAKPIQYIPVKCIDPVNDIVEG